MSSESTTAPQGLSALANPRAVSLKTVATIVGVAAAIALMTLAFWPTGGRQDLVLRFTNLAPLANGFEYEGWAVLDGKAWSTGRFNVSPVGGLVGPDGKPISDGVYNAGRDLTGAMMVAITIQPPAGSADNPATDDDGFGGDAPPHLLAGVLTDFNAGLSSSASPALGASYADVSGSYRLDHGHVHFTDLTLAPLPAGWAYEAWAVIDGVPESLARFGQADGGDADGHTEHQHDPPAADIGTGEASTTAPGAVQAPSHLAPSSDIRGGTLFISIEPAPDDSPLPYSLRPLTAHVPANAGAGTPLALANGSSTFPTGTATIK
jgi:hypothetical protein